jgi:hypothetical protein
MLNEDVEQGLGKLACAMSAVKDLLMVGLAEAVWRMARPV